MAGVSSSGGVAPTDFRPRSSGVTQTDKIGGFRGRKVSSQPPSVSQFSSVKESASANKALSSRSISGLGDMAQSKPASSSSGLMTSEQMIAKAGAPKTGLLKNSGTYQKLLGSLNAYHKLPSGASPGVKLAALSQVKDTAGQFLAKKQGESEKGSASGTNQLRQDGTKAVLASVEQERAQVLQGAVEQLAHASGDLRPLAAEIAGESAPNLAKALATLPEKQCIKALGAVLENMREVAHDNCKALDIVVSLRKQSPLPPEVFDGDMGTAIAHGEPHENAQTVIYAHSQGVLDVSLLAGVAQNNLQLLGGGEMMERPGAEQVMATVDYSALEGSKALAAGKDNVVGSIQSDGSPAFRLQLLAQANMVTIDRLLKACGNDPGLKAMIMAWDSLVMEDMRAYNKSVPTDKFKKDALDISTAEFNRELSKLDSFYFEMLAQGQVPSAEDYGWAKLPAGWQQDPDIKPTQDQMISDFFARHAPGMGSVADG